MKNSKILGKAKKVVAVIMAAAVTATTLFPGIAGSTVNAAGADDMVLHWDMTKNEDGTLKDLTGNGHSGKTNGDVASAEVEGIDVLKMTGGYVDIPDGTISTDATEITVNMLVKIEKNIPASWMWCLGSSNKRYMYFTGCCSSNQGSVMRGGVGCVPDSNFANGNGWSYESVINGNSPLTVGEWQNVTITYKDGGKYIFYKNGEQQAETVLSEGAAGNFTLQQLMKADDERDGYMGWSFYTGQDPKFQGTVADFRIYEKEMTGDEVKTLSDDMAAMLEDLASNDFTAADINLTEEDCLGEENEAKDKITADLVLPKTTTIGKFNKEGTIEKWVSSNPDVISNDGKVTPGLKDTTVTMTATVTREGNSADKVLTFVVPGSATEADLAKADAEGLTIRNSDDVSGNLTLPTTGTYGSKITWTSSDESVITSKANGSVAAGKVTRQDVEKEVTLTATVTYGEAVETKEIVCYVRRKAEVAPTTDYLFAYFPYTDFKDERVYFGISEDGLNFDALNGGKPVLESRKGTHGIRDPFVIRSHEGDKFYMIATDLTVAGLNQDGQHYPGMGWGDNQVRGSQSIVVWESDDLVNWSEERLCKVSVDNAGCTWAPEAYWDDVTEQYVVFWASKTGDDNYGKQRVYYATTRDFYTFSEAKVWIEEEGSVIDTTVIKVGDYFYRYTKNEDGRTNTYGTPSKRIYCERSKSLTSTDWEIVHPNSLDISGGQIEGGCIFKINTDDVENTKKVAALKGFNLTNDDIYCLAADRTGATIFPGVSDDITKGNFNVLGTSSGETVNGTKIYSMPDPVASHGTIMPITSEEYDRLMKKWDSTYSKDAEAVSDKADQLMETTMPETEEDFSEITGDIVLPTTEEEGVTISWKSSNPKVVSDTGEVTRPGAKDGDQTVELTVTIKVEGTGDVRDQIRTMTYRVVVKANEFVMGFGDVSESDWFYEGVDYVYKNELMIGKDETHFAPYENLARAQFALILHRIEGEPEGKNDKTFPDVADGEWYTNAVLWAASSDVEIIKGYTDTGLFGTADNITREQMAVMMYRYAVYKNYEITGLADFGKFSDADEVSEFAKEAMQWAFGNGIITGKDNGTRLDPQGNTSRAECAIIIQRFMEKIAK